MIENPAVTNGGISNNYDGFGKTISFELDIFGEPVTFSIRITQKQARLSDIIPLARTLSTKMTNVMLDRFRRNGEFVPCCKGCSACCNYLVPLSIPEVFRLREEVLNMPVEQRIRVLQSCLDTAKRIFDSKPKEFDINELAKTKSQIQLRQISKWYAGLDLACPFLSDCTCTIYKHRPVACREYIVTGSALSCEAEWTDDSHVVQMPVRILECIGQLSAELEQTDIEAVILPLALPWALLKIERGKRTWPAVTMVERFVEILRALNIEQSKTTDYKKTPGQEPRNLLKNYRSELSKTH